MAEKIFVATLENQEKIIGLLESERPKRYGYRVKVSEPDPERRVEYLYDAVGMTPAKMNYTAKKFEYGSWEHIWFVERNYPVVLNADGSEKYRLDPNDYSKRWDGETASDLPSGVTADKLTNGENVMSAIPLVWVKRYHEGDYRYVIFCETQYDESYKAYAHTNAKGEVLPYVYHAVYEGWLDNVPTGTDAQYVANQAAIITGCTKSGCPNKSQCNAVATAKIKEATCQAKMRSVSGVQPTSFTPSDWELATAQRNGAGWNIGYWSLNELIADLLTLMAKNCNSQAAFGQGHTERNVASGSTDNGWLSKTGTMDKKGQFWGSNCKKPNNEQCPKDGTAGDGVDGETLSGVKVFHIENFWGDRWERQLGMIGKNGNLLVKMTPEGNGYNLTGDGYAAVQESKKTASGNGFRKQTVQTEYGALPVTPCTGSETTYETDYFWWQVDGTARFSLFGGACNDGGDCGARCWSVADAASDLGWGFGASLSYVKSSR